MADASELVADLVVALVTCMSVGAVVLLHFEGLNTLATRTRVTKPHTARRRVMKVIFCVLLLHITQIVLFGCAWWALLQWPPAGSITGWHSVNLYEAMYLSSMAFTSLGFDGAAPLGAIRLLAGIEALTGLVVITWSASFTYLEMTRHWKMD